jgi:hypothetical protein
LAGAFRGNCSDEWWNHIEQGDLRTYTLRGVITRIYMGSMNDWPEFEIRADEGGLSQWTREANSKELSRAYAPNRRAEIDYVLQKHRPKSFDRGAEAKIVIEIRVSGEQS